MPMRYSEDARTYDDTALPDGLGKRRPVVCGKTVVRGLEGDEADEGDEANDDPCEGGVAMVVTEERGGVRGGIGRVVTSPGLCWELWRVAKRNDGEDEDRGKNQEPTTGENFAGRGR
jgi:hypothetical protein